MDELGQLILGERPSKARELDRSSVIAPKISSMTGFSPNLKAEEEKPDELGQLILGSSKPTAKQTKQESGSFMGTLASAADIVAGAPAAIAGTVGYGAGRLFGLSPEEATAASQKVAGKLAEPVGRATSLAGKPEYQQSLPSQVMNYIGDHIHEGSQAISKQLGIPVQDVENAINALGIAASVRGAKPVAKGAGQSLEQAFTAAKEKVPSVRIEPTFQPAGAAATTNKAMLDSAISQATPELAAQLAKENPKTISPQSLERYVDADSLPVPVRLTKGQAMQDPSLISWERNNRGQNPALAEALSQQNKALQENVSLVKEKTAPDVFAPDYVANAEGAIEFLGNKVKQNEEATSKAYKELENFGAGKIEVDSKTFADNAIKSLLEKEDIDFLPPAIENKIKAYQEGKSMNFDQYENLRSQIAKESRKFDKAGDGNAVHALNLVRAELEKLPLLGETAEAKVFADKARASAKSEFDLVNTKNPAYNKTYADLVNGKIDTKDFIQSAILRSKNKDFAKTMELFSDDPVALQNLRAGALDLIAKEATDASGNFKSGKFSKAIDNLDVNKKLDVLFGEDAQILRKIAKTGQLVEARPAGAFVNESNTSVANLAAQYGKKLAEQTPIVGRFVEPARQIMAERQAQKAVAESLRPGAGVKLSNIGKEK
jgi:hypothetical protein